MKKVRIMLNWVEFITLLIIVVAGYFSIRTPNLLFAVIALSALSLLLSLEFYLLKAPDVAIAEAGIGAALTTAVYILAIYQIEKRDKKK